MILDVSADNHLKTEQDGTEQLNLRINKIHAVLQAAAIGELGDLIDHIQVGPFLNLISAS